MKIVVLNIVDFDYLTKYQCIFDYDVLKKIKFITENENLSITTQLKLLKAKFLTLSILNCNLINIIQKYKVEAEVTHDAFYLLKNLIQH
ncbi:11512_t:CDS:2 [Funneliformis geosporum]|uniref:11512_t:CDS:1 n=1 Tax=Funneliformis geosporum TaxID=1117311 RepID=A0A9W4SDK6_9GLOM|nr:11512_t:CDS:2 [Funneliformis geosporum]